MFLSFVMLLPPHKQEQAIELIGTVTDGYTGDANGITTIFYRIVPGVTFQTIILFILIQLANPINQIHIFSRCCIAT